MTDSNATPSNTDTARLKRVRRKAAHEGQYIVKMRADSPWFQQYGPFMIVDLRGDVVVASGLDLDHLEWEYELAGEDA
jgi:hypothetical protein